LLGVTFNHLKKSYSPHCKSEMKKKSDRALISQVRRKNSIFSYSHIRARYSQKTKSLKLWNEKTRLKDNPPLLQGPSAGENASLQHRRRAHEEKKGQLRPVGN